MMSRRDFAPRDLRYLVLLVAIGAITLLAYYDAPIADADLWWHMAYGRTVVENGSPRIDHADFAWTADEIPFYYVTWLGDVTLWATHEFGGTTALSFLQAGLYLVVAMIFLRTAGRGRGRLAPSAVLLLIVAFLCMRSSTVLLKNTMFSVLFYALLFAILWRFRRGNARPLIALPGLFLVWVNTHGEVVIGVAVLGAYTACELVVHVLRRQGALSRIQLLRLTCAAGASVTALLANPEGWRLPYSWAAGALSAQSVNGAGVIADTIAPYTRLLIDDPLGAPWAVAVWIWLGLSLQQLALLLRLIWQRHWRRLPFFLVCTLCVLLSWTMARLIVVGVLAWLFSAGSWSLHRRALSRPRPRIVAAAGLTVLMLGAVFSRVAIQGDVLGRSDRLTTSQPVAAARFVAEHDLPNPIFNDYLTGGYLIWALGESHPVFIDPRYGPYDPRLLAAYFQFERQPNVEELEEMTANAELRTAIVRHRGWQGRMCLFFQDAPSWELVFVGPNAAVYVHREAMTPTLEAAAERALRAENFAAETNVTVFAGIHQALVGTSPGEVLRLQRLAEENVPDHKLLKRRLSRSFRQYCITRAFAHGRNDGETLSRDQVRQRFAMYVLNGQVDLARLVATGYLEVFPDDAEMHYDLASVEAQAGDFERATTSLLAALEHGYDEVEVIRSDPALAPLLARPAIRDRLGQVEAAAEGARETEAISAQLSRASLRVRP